MNGCDRVYQYCKLKTDRLRNLGRVILSLLLHKNLLWEF